MLKRAGYAIRLGVRNLLLHKLRSFLTVLGLVFGVSSVIVMLGIAEGASLEAQRQLESLGATNLIVRSIKPVEDSKKKDDGDFVISYGLTYLDLERCKGATPTATGVIPLREFTQEARRLDYTMECHVVGVTPEYADMNRIQMLEGRFLADLDLLHHENCCVIGSQVAETLFPLENPLGKPLLVGPQCSFIVIGVTKFKAGTAGAGGSLAAQDFNRDVYIPLTTDRARFGKTLFRRKSGSLSGEKIELSQLTISVASIDAVKPTAALLDSLLGQFHPKKDYNITVPLELLEKAEATKRIFNMVLGSIAAISLLVGGIGIMNIMLATVTERTREIGIRRALGAKRRDITLQFLIETAVLSATGGALGVAVGLGVPPLVSKLSGLQTSIPSWSAPLAFAIAVSVGVVFGLYPARRAAFMDPIDALRAE